jgi:hypothetical protein
MGESHQLCAPAVLSFVRSELSWHTDQAMGWMRDEYGLDSREGQKINLFSKELRSAPGSN